MRQAATAGVRLDDGKAVGSSPARPSVWPFWLSAGRLGRISLRRNPQERKIASNKPGIRGTSFKYARWTAHESYRVANSGRLKGIDDWLAES